MVTSRSLAAMMLVVGASAGSLMLAQPAAAKTCKSSSLQGGGAAQTQIVARENARIVWASGVTQRYGVAWASWLLANAQEIDCNRNRTQWVCRATAIPCML